MEHVIIGHTPSVVRVFAIPELLFLINSHCGEIGDTARLSQVCRRTFQVLVPLLWKNIDGVEILLALIPSTSFRYNKSTGELQEVILKDQLDDNQFVRFDLYAQFVNVLDVYPADRPFFTVSGLPVLISQAQTRPLLPNLTVLLVHCEKPHTSGLYIPLWTRAFGCPTVQGVSTCPDDYWLYRDNDDWSITPASASEILNALADRCPGLQKLTLCPRNWSASAIGFGFVYTPGFFSPWYQHLEDLSDLRHVFLGEGWVSYQSLVALGKLPRLESFETHLQWWQGLDFPYNLDGPNHDLPDGTFPALRHLSIKGIESRRVTDLLSLRRLLEPITSLELIHEIPIDEDGEDDWMAHKFLPLLANAPCLRDLQITDHYSVASTNEYCLRHIGIPEILDVMARLPLNYIHLELMHLGVGSLNLDLGIVWPSVTVLVMPSQYASLQELSYFAAMPNLRRLNVRLDMTTTHTPWNIPYSYHAPISELESSLGAKLPQNFDLMTHNIRVLHQLWPHLATVVWNNVDIGQPLFSNLSKSFNHLLAAHRVLNMYQTEGYGGDDKAGNISVLKSVCEHFRLKVDRGVEPYEGQQSDSSSDFSDD